MLTAATSSRVNVLDAMVDSVKGNLSVGYQCRRYGEGTTLKQTARARSSLWGRISACDRV